MTPLLLRQVWSLIEATQASQLLTLDDSSLIQMLLGKIGSDRSLDHNETSLVRSYIHSRLTLIRDLAQER